MDIKNEMTVKGKISTVIGADGKSAYELAVLKGFQGTLEEWLGSLRGEKGVKGDKPIKNVDYFTPSDKAELVKDVEKEAFGDIEEALDNITDLQESYINGEITGSLVEVVAKKTYPIGSVYMSVNDTSPASLFGGTWERLKDRFLLGAGDTYTAGATGGSATHSHSHDLWADIYMFGEGTEHRNKGYIMAMKGKSHENFRYMDYALSDGVFDEKGKLTDTLLTRVNLPGKEETGSIAYKNATDVGGTIGSSNNLPPYLAVYMWKRVA